MNTRFNLPLFFICLLISINTGATSISNGLLAHDKVIVGDPCSLPAPTNFKVTDITPFSLTVVWDPQIPAPSDYSIKVFETSSGNLIQSYKIPGNSTSTTVTNLEPNKKYIIRNTPFCPGGTESVYFVDAIGATWIVDLVSSGYTPVANLDASCGMGASGQSCSADPDEGYIVPFRIRRVTVPTAVGDFGLYHADNCVSRTIKTGINLDGFTFYCDNGQSTACSGTMIIAKHADSVVARITIGSTLWSGVKKLVCVSISPGFRIERLYPDHKGYLDQHGGECALGFGQLPGKANARTEESFEMPPAIQRLSAHPNPFADYVEIQVPFANISQNLQLSLHDLQGRRVMVLDYPSGQQTIQLSTLGLSPGMYFLHAESGGITSTIKLVKTQ
jgi:hypothetical protein